MNQFLQLSIEQRWHHYREPALLAATAGFIDTLGFVALYGLFTAHVTGNLVIAGAELAGGRLDVLAKLLAIPTFVLTVMATAWWLQRSAVRDAHLLAKALLIESLWLSAFMVCGLLFSPLQGADGWSTIVTGMLGVIAMAIRNTITRLLLGAMTPSTVMTGNVTQLAIDVTNVLSRDKEAPAARIRIKKILPAVLGFTIGAALGASGYALLGFASVALPIVITLALAFREFSAAVPAG